MVPNWKLALFVMAMLCISTTYADPDRGDYDAVVDAATEFVVYENRGVTFRRTGTIFSHPQMNLMSAVITLNPLKHRRTHENVICRESLWNVERRFNATMQKYKNITDAIFQSKTIFSTGEVCQIFDYDNDYTNSKICPNYKATSSKNKRFASLGAYALGGAAMATATSALGLATANRVDLEKVENYLEEQEESIFAVQQQMIATDNSLDIVLDTQKSILGYIQQMSTKIDDLNSKVDCFFKHFSYLHWADELQAEVENLLQFVFTGQLHGKLTPTLIRPDLLRTFIERQSTINSKILGKYPNMLYSSAMATLLKADFEHLQFTFLIAFPNFGKDPIYPFFTINQNGFWARIPESNETVCLMFTMPQTAVIHDNRLYALKNNINCADFGNVLICNRDQLDMMPMSECMNLQANLTKPHDIALSPCQLTQCIGNLQNDDVYLSSSSGLLLRTRSPTVDIVYDKPQHQLDLFVSAMVKTVYTPKSGALFVPWHKNVSAVSFTKTVVYSPINANHHVKLTQSRNDEIATLGLFSLLSVPSAGTRKISEIIQNQQQRLQNLENEMEPTYASITKWATDTFTIPFWLKAILFAAFTLASIATINFLYKFCKKSKYSCIAPKATLRDAERHYHRPETNTLYPQLPISHRHPTLPQSDDNMQIFTAPTREVPTLPYVSTVPTTITSAPATNPPTEPEYLNMASMR